MVKPVYTDHPRETGKVVFMGRWSLSTGFFGTCFNKKPFSKETKNTVFVEVTKAGLAVHPALML